METCEHNLTDLMFRVGGSDTYELIGLKYCTYCKKIFSETLKEIPFK